MHKGENFHKFSLFFSKNIYYSIFAVKLKLTEIKKHNMINFKVDSSCTQCGVCATICLSGIIRTSPKIHIPEAREKNCLKCQHCMAVCKEGAISILDKKPEDSVQLDKNINISTELDYLVKMRRSVRSYKSENVDKNIINSLIETTSYAPTGHNDNNVMFSVIDNIDDMNLFRDEIYSAIKIKADNNDIPAKYLLLRSAQKVWSARGMDLIFRGAPHLLITSSPKKSVTAKENCLIAMSYFELLASSNGLGTLWNGMVQWIADEISPELKNKLGIPEDHIFGYAMSFGIPKIKYQRSIQNDKVNVNRVTFG